MHTGTKGEQEIQKDQGSTNRANKFYHKQMKTHLTESMAELINKQEMVFISTSDAAGNCDCSPRFGKAGFISIIDKHTLAYPEYKGNGAFLKKKKAYEQSKAIRDHLAARKNKPKKAKKKGKPVELSPKFKGAKRITGSQTFSVREPVDVSGVRG